MNYVFKRYDTLSIIFSMVYIMMLEYPWSLKLLPGGQSNDVIALHGVIN